MFSSVMEPWNYGSEGKGFKISDEIVSPADALQRNRQVLTGWDFRSSCNYDDSMELGFPGNVCRSFPDNQIGGDLRNKDGYGRTDVSSCSSHLVNPRAACFREDESGTSIVDSNSWDSSLIDLKLGSLTDCGDGKSAKCSKDLQMLSSIVSSIPAKRARLSNLSTRPSFCQVHGCNMDLNSSKDYYKRHRVCEIHSKTAKVIVNGIQQRFCQQCSRFHLLAEFDDGKRSCRKRLAGHNERRRKPKLDNHPGGRYLGTSIPAIIPFICQDMFPSGLLNEIRHENDNNFYRCVKVEEKPIYSTQTSFPLLTPYGTEKQFPSLNASSFTMSYNNSNRYAQGLASPQPVSKSVGKVSMNDELSVLDVSSTIHGLSGVMDSGCALSLLSSQSHSSSTQNFGLPFTRPLLVQGGVQHGATQYNQFPEKLLAVSSQGSNSVASNRFSSSGMNSVENEHLGTVLVSDASNAVEVENQADGMFHRMDYMKQKDHISYGDHESTVDLLQLSSQLQSVEHPRHSIQVKKEMEVFMTAPSSVWATRTCHVRDNAEELTMLEESQKLDNSFHLMNGFHSG